MVNVLDAGLEEIFGAIMNWGRWSDIAAIGLPNMLFGVITFEQILSNRVLELFLLLLFVQEQKNQGFISG